MLRRGFFPIPDLGKQRLICCNRHIPYHGRYLFVYLVLWWEELIEQYSEWQNLTTTLTNNMHRLILEYVGPVFLNVGSSYITLQCNHITPSVQLICITTTSIKCWYKQNNNNPDYTDDNTKQGLSNSYWATTLPINKCKKRNDIFLFLGITRWFNTLPQSINQDCKRFLLFREKNMSSNIHTRNHE